MMNTTPEAIEVPKEAASVVYLYPNTRSTLQRPLFNDGDTSHPNRVTKKRDDIRKADAGGNSYGVIFKDKEHKEMPHMYIIRAEGIVKDLMDTLNQEYSIEQDLEEAYASEALKGTALTTYIKAKLAVGLVFLPFDPQKTIIAP